jgi:hypothetical protein
MTTDHVGFSVQDCKQPPHCVKPDRLLLRRTMAGPTRGLSNDDTAQMQERSAACIARRTRCSKRNTRPSPDEARQRTQVVFLIDVR